MRKLLGCLALCGMLLAPGAAFADKPVALSVLPGAGFTLGDAWSRYHTSFYLAGEGEMGINEHWASGLLIGYFFGHSDGADLKREFKNLEMLPYAKYYFSTEGAWKPYAVAGAGVVLVNYDDDASHPDIDDSTKRYFGYMAGAGISWQAAKNVELGVDLRLHQIFRQQFTLTTLAPTAVARIRM